MRKLRASSVAKLEKLTGKEGDELYLFYCPGCGYRHHFITNSRTRPNWTFNGDMQNPTFEPSLLVNQHDDKHRCHLFLTGGVLRYCHDSHHELAGKDVPLPELDD